MSAEPPQQFHLSFVKMTTWIGRYILLGSGIALAIAIVIILPLFFLSKLPLSMIGAPIMLAIMPVGVVLLVFAPVLFGALWLVERFYVYEVNELGIELGWGRLKNRVDWLTVETVEEAAPYNLEVLRLYELRKDTPTTLFTMFLQDAQGFYSAIAANCPPTGQLYHYVCGDTPENKTISADSFAQILSSEAPNAG